MLSAGKDAGVKGDMVWTLPDSCCTEKSGGRAVTHMELLSTQRALVERHTGRDFFQN